MQFLSNSPLKSIAAAAVALMVLAIPAQADDCNGNCVAAATQAQQAAETSAAAAVQSYCSQNAHTYEDYAACMTSGQATIQSAGQTAFNNTLSQCNGYCTAAHY